MRRKEGRALGEGTLRRYADAIRLVVFEACATGANPATSPVICAASSAATACTPSDVSLPPTISAVNAPTHPSGDKSGATTAPFVPPGRFITICSMPVRYAAAAAL